MLPKSGEPFKFGIFKLQDASLNNTPVFQLFGNNTPEYPYTDTLPLILH